MREPACWEMRWPEVSVLDGNANALGIAEPSLMDLLEWRSQSLLGRWLTGQL
ncbi:MAG: hypothetical protein Ct9H300mP30_3340 [Methanobacteriota archaeon]|nr:MAG: hypothetical protein Ct9H300mP30_3340 [Euryarchaeota archaeon]